MASKITICSNALIKLGSKPISSFNENSDNAARCSNIYDTVRDAVLRAHAWNCAIKRIQLAPSATVPVFGFSFAFDMPVDMLRILEVDSLDDHKVEGRQILGDENPLFIKYVYRNEDVSSYDVLLVEVLTAAIASELTYAITKSTTKSAEMSARFDAILRKATNVDGQEDTPDQMGISTLVSARRR